MRYDLSIKGNEVHGKLRELDFLGSRKEREGTAQRALKEIGFKLLRAYRKLFAAFA